MNKFLRNLGILVAGLFLAANVAQAVSVFLPFQGGTGKGTAVSGDIGKFLQVSNNSPLTYTFASAASTLANIASNSTDATKALYTMTSTIPVEFKTSGGTHLLYLDETNGRVGIGTATPSNNFQIVSSANNAVGVTITNSGAAGWSGISFNGQATFASGAGPSNAPFDGRMALNMASGVPFAIAFNATRTHNFFSNGNVGINTGSVADAGVLLQIGTNTTTAAGGILMGTDLNIYRSGSNGALTMETSSNGPTLRFRNTGTLGAWTIGQPGGSGDFSIVSSNQTGNALLLAGNSPHLATFGGTLVLGATTGTSSITGGAGNMTILSGTGASRTLIFQTTTSGSAATTALTLGADQSSTFAGPIVATYSGSAGSPNIKTNSGSGNSGTIYFNDDGFGYYTGFGVGNINIMSIYNTGIKLIAGSSILLNGLTTNGTGALQFAAATTTAGGITMGTDVNIYRSATSTLAIATGGSTALTINSSQNVGIGDTNPTAAKLSIIAGSLASTINAVSITGTLSGTNATQIGVNQSIVTAGSSANLVIGYSNALTAGFTGAGQTIANNSVNTVAGTGTDLFGGNANYGFAASTQATTVGVNVGGFGSAFGGSTSVGVTGLATTAKNSAVNIGVLGFGRNTGTSPVQIGGYFGLQTTAPTFASAALMADNGAVASDIFVARDNGTAKFTVLDGGNVNMQGLTSTYNGVATVGWGVPAVYGAGRATAQTAANTSVSTYTVGAADGSFEVSANVLVTTSSAENFTVTCSYTDEGNTARVLTLNFQTIAAVIGTAINFTNGAVPYEGLVVHIRAKASTAITIKTTGTFTGATYNVEGIIKQTN